MPRKAEVLYSLTRGRVRASWNKHNLFNLYKKGRIGFQGQNLYQQKWLSKQETRAYHGEFLTESRFQTKFSSKLESVANLDASLRGGDLANSDKTPYTLQTYAVLEKRLDFALFRAMFASSIRQARQFILHGYVSVNGIKITQPGFELKPGDVFNIEPEKALFALGATKPSLKQAIQVDQTQVHKWNEFVARARANPKKVWEELQAKKSRNAKKIDADDEEAKLNKIKELNNTIEKTMLTDQKNFTRNKALSTVIELGLKSNELSNYETYFNKEASEKAQKLFTKLTESFSEEFSTETLKSLDSETLSTKIDEFLSKKYTESIKSDSTKKSYSEVKQLVSSVQNIHHEKLRADSQARKLPLDPSTPLSSLVLPYDPNWIKSLSFHKHIPKASKILESPNVEKLKSLSNKPATNFVNLPWQKGFFGHNVPSKPYFTPFKLRPFIAPFAILPAHLEISFKTCHAVYLRDPVSMSGKSEVISPFDESVHERAYMWYIRRVKTSKQ